jgi:AraC-like DNA-binding protein
MGEIDRRLSAGEVDRMEAGRAELAERIARAVPEDGRVEALDGVFLRRASSPTEATYGVSDIALCVVAQGSKVTLVGGSTYRYDPAHYLVTTTELPIMSRITEASVERPYLSIVMSLDPVVVGSIIVEDNYPEPRGGADVRAINVSPLDEALLDTVVRLVRLVDAPADARFLAPLVTREIVYRLLKGEQGARLRHAAILGGSSPRIVRAIERLRRDFDQPLRIEHLAGDLGMSVSSFHHHFKAVTAMSPLQFQKQLRLQEARRLMLGEGYDAATAGYRVGYDDASHFNREYKRLFGAPPMRDVARLRTVVAEPAGL